MNSVNSAIPLNMASSVMHFRWSF